MSREYRVAVVGATGAVGRAMRSILEERRFPITPDSFKGMDLALFSAGGGISLKFASIARDAGCVVRKRPEHVGGGGQSPQRSGTQCSPDRGAAGRTQPGPRAPLYGQKYRSGLVKTETTTVMFSNGVGTTFLPVRFFARPQIVEITLRCAIKTGH